MLLKIIVLANYRDQCLIYVVYVQNFISQWINMNISKDFPFRLQKVVHTYAFYFFQYYNVKQENDTIYYTH